MSFDLAVWEGDYPASDEMALVVFEQLMEIQDEDPPRLPTPRIRAYVEALLRRWPDLTEATDEDECPWADGPLMGDATGPIFYFGMVISALHGEGEDNPMVYASRLAHDHNLVCFDPQGGELLPRVGLQQSPPSA